MLRTQALLSAEGRPAARFRTARRLDQEGA